MRTPVADDQPDVVEGPRLVLKSEGFQIDTAHSPAAVIEKVCALVRDYDVLDLLAHLDSTQPVVVTLP